MSKDKYAQAVAEVLSFFKTVSSESRAVTDKVDAYSDQLTGINRNRSSLEAAIFNGIIESSAVDFERYAAALERPIGDFVRSVRLLAEGFAEHVKAINLNTENGRRELEAMRQEVRGLLETATDVKSKVKGLSVPVKALHDSNWSGHLTQATETLIRAAEKLFSAYEEFETFALKVAHTVEEK